VIEVWVRTHELYIVITGFDESMFDGGDGGGDQGRRADRPRLVLSTV
jgi:hypothetical protein